MIADRIVYSWDPGPIGLLVDCSCEGARAAYRALVGSRSLHKLPGMETGVSPAGSKYLQSFGFVEIICVCSLLQPPWASYFFLFLDSYVHPFLL